MASSAQWSDNVAHIFPPGTKVEAHPRVSDSLLSAPLTSAETSATVDDQGVVTFKGLKNPHGPYWAYASVPTYTPEGKKNRVHRRIAFTANPEDDLADPSERVRPSETRRIAQAEAEARDRFAQRFPESSSPAPGRSIITGPRNTVNTHPANPDNFEPKVDEPQPHAKQEDVKGWQRSSTPAGQATPVDLGELQPRPSQSDVKKGTPQRSSTEHGEATPKPPDEQVPQARQEDSQGRRQRSDTPHGTQAPKPGTRSKREQEKAKDASESKAVGATKPVAGTAKRKRASDAGKARKATDSVKPASKRAAKKQDN
jgi:hypothetical protein